MQLNKKLGRRGGRGDGGEDLSGEGSKWMCGLRVWYYMLLGSRRNSIKQFIQAWFYTVWSEIS